MKAEALAQYNTALKAGQKYYKTAVSRGKYPYPLVLDEILPESSIAGYDNLGILEIPTDSVIGTRFAGRKDALPQCRHGRVQHGQVCDCDDELLSVCCGGVCSCR